MHSSYFFKYHFQNTDHISNREINTLNLLTYWYDIKLSGGLDTNLQGKKIDGIIHLLCGSL